MFLSQCSSLTTHESGDGRTVGGVSVKTRVSVIDNSIAPPCPLPIPTEFMSNNASVCMFISLYLVCEGVCVPALTVQMCVALILVFPLTIPHLLPSFSLHTFGGYTLASSSISNQTLFIYPLILYSYTKPRSTPPVPRQHPTTSTHLSIH